VAIPSDAIDSIVNDDVVVHTNAKTMSAIAGRRTIGIYFLHA